MISAVGGKARTVAFGAEAISSHGPIGLAFDPVAAPFLAAMATTALMWKTATVIAQYLAISA